MSKYTILHYVEKTYYDGSIKRELTVDRNPLSIKPDLSLVAIRFYDRNKPIPKRRQVFQRLKGLK